MEFLGHVAAEHLERLYRNAKLFVLPTRDELFGLAIIEAMAAGLPIVCTRVGALPELVTCDVGLLVEREKPEALAAAIRSLIDDKARYCQMREAAVRRAGLFTWERTVDEFEAAVEGMRGLLPG